MPRSNGCLGLAKLIQKNKGIYASFNDGYTKGFILGFLPSQVENK
jgi:tetrahydromethanopterin S-methyltransferase subunit F